MPPIATASNPPSVTMEDRIVSSIVKGFEVSIGDRRAIEREMRDAQKEILQRSEMIARHLSDIATAVGSSGGRQTHRRVASDVTNLGVEASNNEISPAALGQEGPLPVPPGGRGGWNPSIKHASTSGADLYKESRGSIRARAAQAVNRRAEGWVDHRMEGVGTLGYDQKGRLIATREGISVTEHGRLKGSHGLFVSPEEGLMPAGTAEKAVRAASLAGRISDVANAWSEGQPFAKALLSALPARAAVAAGTAAGVIGVANQAWQWTQGQYAANRDLQEYYGGSNTDQLGERLNRFTNSIRGRFSLLGQSNYDELWKMAMERGKRGGRRDQFIATGASLMGQGVNGQQTGQILDIALGTGQSLAGLADAIRDVNAAAREAGVSAKEARDNFITNYQLSSNYLFGSGSAKQLATGLTTGVTELGESYSGVSYGGMFSDQQRFANAQRNGLTSTELIQADTVLPGVNIKLGEDGAREALRYAASNRPGARSIPEVVNSFLREIGGKENFVPERHLVELGNRIQAEGYDFAYIAPILQNYGISFSSPAQALGIAGLLFIPGESVGDRTVAESARNIQNLRAGGSNIKIGSVGSASDIGNIDVRKRIAQQSGIPVTGGKFFEAALESVSTFKRGGSGGFTYDQQLSPVVRKLIEDAGALGLDPKGTKVLVEVAGGRTREVDLAEAIANFSDQLQAGTAFIKSGAGSDINGKTIAQIMSLPAGWESGTKVTSNTDKSLANRGREYTSADSAKSEQGENKEQSITLSWADPKMGQILQAIINQDAYSTGTPQRQTGG